jgi:hypothetical protein
MRMARNAKILMNNRSQTVLSRRAPKNWPEYLATGPVASSEFMKGVEDLPLQERAVFDTSSKDKALLTDDHHAT